MRKTILFFVLAAFLLCSVPCPALSSPAAKIGRFSVSPSHQVVFSPGNVQYSPASKTWRFAPNQYDALGEANAMPGSAWIDLFPFGTGDRPMYYAQSSEYTVFVDWGINFGEGWRTLTDSEWDYLLLKRPYHDKLCVPATVCGMEGVVLLPDDWDGPAVKPMYWNSSFTSNVYDKKSWAAMEAAGAIFLPAAGEVDDGFGKFRVIGHYWAASAPSQSEAFSSCYCFTRTTVWRQSARHSLLRSVRLAKDAL